MLTDLHESHIFCVFPSGSFKCQRNFYAQRLLLPQALNKSVDIIIGYLKALRAGQEQGSTSQYIKPNLLPDAKLPCPIWKQ